MKFIKKFSQVYEHLDNVFGTILGMPNYEKYIEHVREFHPEKTPLSKKEFYKEYQDSKDGKINRCC